MNDPEVKVFYPKWDYLKMNLFPDSPAIRIAHDCGEGRRIAAIKHVLAKLPKEALDKFAEMNEREPFYWAVFPVGYEGLTDRFPHGNLIYLCPLLEFIGVKAIAWVVAHELAHYLLGHLDIPPEERRSEINEPAANEMALEKWKFVEELKEYEDTPKIGTGVLRKFRDDFMEKIKAAIKKPSSDP